MTVLLKKHAVLKMRFFFIDTLDVQHGVQVS